MLNVINHVQKAVFILVFVIQHAHQLTGGRYGRVAVHEQRRLLWQFDAPAYNMNKGAHGAISWHQELVLVYLRGVGGVDILFKYDRHSVRVLEPNPSRLLFSEVQGVLFKTVKHGFFLQCKAIKVFIL